LQRGRGVEAKLFSRTPEAQPKVTAPKPAQAGKPAKRLSFHDQHALKSLPARMQALEKEIARLQSLLADPALYARDPAGFSRASAELAEATGELSAAEDRWLELELLREEASARG
jgi:ATP-binding cassette subfamily F protein uup